MHIGLNHTQFVFKHVQWQWEPLSYFELTCRMELHWSAYAIWNAIVWFSKGRHCSKVMWRLNKSGSNDFLRKLLHLLIIDDAHCFLRFPCQLQNSQEKQTWCFCFYLHSFFVPGTRRFLVARCQQIFAWVDIPHGMSLCTIGIDGH